MFRCSDHGGLGTIPVADVLTSLSNEHVIRVATTEVSLLALPQVPQVPDFLGGSAPCLRYLSLQLEPGYSYISSDEVVSCLSAVQQPGSRASTFILDSSNLTVISPQVRNREGYRLAPPTRIVLPDLTHFSWKGTSSYLNKLLAWVNAPQLYSMKMTLNRRSMRDSEAPEIALFIGRTERFKEPNRANISILPRSTELLFPLRIQAVDYPSLKLVVKYPKPLWSLRYSVQTCHSSFLPLSTVERLDIESVHCQPLMKNTEWLEVFGFFVSVKDLCVSKDVVLQVVQALQQQPSVERAPEVLPALRNLFIEGLESSGPAQEALEQFTTARQLSGHPVAVCPWTPFKVGPEKSMFEDEDEDEDEDYDDDYDDDEDNDDGG